MDCGQYCQAWWGSWWPWAEANQGFLSIAALVTALAFFLVEQRRANEAEKSAKDLARAAELKEQEKLRIQKIEQRAHANAEKRRMVSEFISAIRDVLNGFIAEGREGAEQRRELIGFATIETEIVGALRSLERVCPSDAAFLRLLHRAIAIVSEAASRDVRRAASGLRIQSDAGKIVDDVEQKLWAVIDELRSRQKALANFWS